MYKVLILLSGFFAAVVASQHSQKPLSIASQSLASLVNSDTSAFENFRHPSFPSYGLRIKKVKDFCDTTVNVYSGYLDVAYGTKHLFFYFFESRNDPVKDDVLMWINGGS
jgi:carboxypeptidase C (cathepsin A)